MGRKIEIEVGGKTYSGATTSAKDQVEMLQLAASAGLLPVLNEKVTDLAIVAGMATADTASQRRLKDLALKNGNIVRDEDGAPVAENLFQDEAHNYLLLLGQVIKANIGPFWQLSSGVNERSSNEE